MDKFWEKYITTRPANSKGAFDAFKQMHQDPRPMAHGPRNMEPRIGLGGGGFLWKLLYRGKPGLQEGSIARKLKEEYIKKGMDKWEALRKSGIDASDIVKQKKLKIVQDQMAKTNYSDDTFVDLIDEYYKLTDYEMYKDIKRWDSTRPALADKTRAIVFPDWAEARYGDDYHTVLEKGQTREIQQSINPNIKEPLSPADQMASNIDEMNKANIAEVIEGKKKHAIGGRVGYNDGQLVTPNVDGSRPGYKGKEILGKEKFIELITNNKAKKKAFNIFKTDLENLNIKSQPNMVKRLRSFGTELDLEGAIKIAKEGGAKIPHGTFKKAKNFEEVINNSKRGGALLTNDILSKSKKYKNVKICKTKFSGGGGGFCGKAFAEAYPQEFLQEVMKDPQMAKYLKSKEALTAGRSILNNVAKVGRWGNPLTLVGGEAWYSTLAGINEFGKGKSLAESVNEGLWFIPGKHSRDLDMLLGSKTKGKAGRNLPVISNEVRGQFDLLTQLGDLINKEGALSGQLAMQQMETERLEDVKAKRLWEERFAPVKAAKDAQRYDYKDILGDIQWSKDIITPQIEKRLSDVGVKGQDIFEKWQAADPTGESYSALQDRIKSKIVDEFNIGKTWDQADPYSGPIWNWIKTREKIPFTDPELVAKQKKLDLLKEGPDQTITKENIPPELIENFLTKFPEYSYIFEGASGGRAGYMGGGIAAIRKPHAIPPERQGLRSIMINVNDD